MSLHETVLDGGSLVIRHKFKPGDEAADEDGDRLQIDDVFVWITGRAKYSFHYLNEHEHDRENVSEADRLWTLIEGGV